MQLPKTPSMRLDGKKALITGAGQGIGLAAAAALAEAGSSVVLIGRTESRLAEAATAVRDAGGQAEYAVVDVTNAAAATAVVAENGPFDILVNNAGTNRPAPFLDTTVEDYDAVSAINVRSTFFVAQAVARGMVAARIKGSIINISSQMGHVGWAGRVVYCATKHAVEGMTKAMAAELGPLGIRVNTICPTIIETALTANFLADAGFRSFVFSKLKLGRLGRIEDVMGAIVFLASDASELMTASPLMLDSGWTSTS